MNKANEWAWLIIALICTAVAIYFGLSLGINNQDTIVLSIAALISGMMYSIRRTRRLKASKK